MRVKDLSERARQRIKLLAHERGGLLKTYHAVADASQGQLAWHWVSRFTTGEYANPTQKQIDLLLDALERLGDDQRAA